MKIRITNDLKNYIEKLQYEASRYNALFKILNTKKDKFKHITEDEWNESYNYYKQLQRDANTRYKIVKDLVVEQYELLNEKWIIDFDTNTLITGEEDIKAYNEEIAKKDFKFEQFSSHMNRLYEFKGFGIKNVTLQITNSCNLRCTYCYQHNKGCKFMEFETAKEFLDLLISNDDKVKNYIDFSPEATQGIILDFIGGEPFVAIDLMTDISYYFIGELFRLKHPWINKFMFSTSSNGILHFDDKVQEYLNTFISFFSYSISIDGNKDLHDACRIDTEGNGSYDRAIAAVKDYESKFNRKIGSKLTISPDNITYLSTALQDMIGNIGYKNINLNCVFEEGWELKHATILYNQLKEVTDWLVENNLQDLITLSIFNPTAGQPLPEANNQNWCGGTGLMISVDCDGNIYPCQRYSETSIKDNPYIIGNIKNGVGSIELYKQRIEDLQTITRKSQSTEECFNCPIASGCAWCSAYNYEKFGTPNKRATYICCMHKARVLAIMYYQKKLNIESKINFPKDWALEIITEQEWENLNTKER